MIHLATIPVDNTSVNPARSFGAAIYSGSDALSQLWAFFVFPLIGGVVGVLIWLFVHNTPRGPDAAARWRCRRSDRARGAETDTEGRLPDPAHPTACRA